MTLQIHDIRHETGTGGRINRLSPIVILFYMYLFATLALVLWGFITQVMHCLMITLDTSGWALLVILSLGPTLFGSLLFTVSPRYLSAPIASLFHTLEPVMTALLAFFSPGPHPDRPSVARPGPDGA